MTRALIPALLLLTLVGAPARLLAQNIEISDSERFARSQIADPNDARQTRRVLQQLLAQHPPAIRIVLQADPSLLNQADYLTPYPRLVAFLKEHPEIARDPAFFFGTAGGAYLFERTAQQQALETLEGVLAGLALFIVAMAVLLVLGSLIRQAIEYRRWLRQSRVQIEVHTKILDRLQSNEDLLAYVQTPAGRRFLESGPGPQDAEPRVIAAPFGRILWSVQLGVMLAALGAGLWLVQRRVMDEIAPAFYAMGVVAVMLGIGAIVSAAASWVLSSRLGLFGMPKG